MSFKAQIVPVTPFQQNCTFLWNEETLQAGVSDPGGDIDLLMQFISETGLTLERILLTHGHLDHVSAAGELAARTGAEIVGPHSGDAFLIEDVQSQCEKYGLPVLRDFMPGRWVENEETVEVAGLSLGVRHCPGHTPGHVAYFHEASRIAIVGDILFAGSVGRTDMGYGDHATLVRSIRERLFPLGDDMTFVPGHGPLSTFGVERRSNPYVADGLFRNG